MTADFLLRAFVFLTAAVVSVPIARRLGLGSVLGYLIAGVAIGPFALDLAGDANEVMHFAEFGVVMMLFLIGLELQPSRLWRLRGPILGLGGLQVVLTAALITGLALTLDRELPQAVAIGMILALSSTAIVLQTLDERGLLRSDAGQSAFSVLLFQDIAVIPMLAAIPALAGAASGGGHREEQASTGAAVGDGHDVEGHGPEGLGTDLHSSTASGADASHAADHAADAAHGHGDTTYLIDLLPDWAQPIMVLVVVAAIVFGGRTVVNPALCYIAHSRLREAFTAASLMLVVGVALAMLHCGLSPALGSFLAGVVLADSEYRHALEADIEPFKGLLLGLFFTSVGAGLDFALIGSQPLLIGGSVLGLIALKGTILTGLGRAFRLPLSQSLRFGLALPQAGEFGFVLVAFASQSGLFGPELSGFLLAVIALSMLITPLLFIVDERLVQPRFAANAASAPQVEPEELEQGDDHKVILCGLGRFGVTVLRYLKVNGIAATVLELDPSQIELVGRFGHKGYFGDASRQELLEAAGAAEAELLIVAIDDRERASRIVEVAREHFPQLKILARARSMQHAYELMDAGVDVVERETFGSALELGARALQTLGFRAHQAYRATRTFRRHEETVMKELIHLVGDAKAYTAAARLRGEELTRLLSTDGQVDSEPLDGAFDTETIRAEVSDSGDQADSVISRL